MDFDIQAVDADDYFEFARSTSKAFGGHQHRDDELRLAQIEWEPGRTLAVRDGGMFVGGAVAVTFRMTVPGAVMQLAGITSVSVLPTHRRRGMLRALMRRQLDDLRDAGESVSTLFASEGGIYQRFGYGLASMANKVSIDRAHVRFLEDARDDGARYRLVEREPALEVIQGVYAKVQPTRPGHIERSPEWTNYLLYDSETHREGFGPYTYMVREGSAGPDGYVVYRMKADWADETPGGVLEIVELMGERPDVDRALWRYVLGVDLMAKIESWNRPLDEPLLYMVEEPRRLRAGLLDGLWVRLIDVEGALAQRRYSVDGDLVLEVSDAFCPWNEGRFRLSGGPGGAECSRTGDEPDLVLTSNELGAAFLGGGSLATMARAGRVTATSEDALRRATMMFEWTPKPWASQWF